MSITRRQLTTSAQLNLGSNESPDIVDISASFISASTSHGCEQSNGTATAVFTDLDGSADSGVDLLLYAGWNGSTDALFYGPIIHRERNTDGTVTLYAQDRLAWLTYPWQKDTRSYITFDPDEATDNSVIQNLVEASGVDSSLTHIEGEGWFLGTIRAVLLEHGDTAMDLIRKINEATPLYDIYSVGNGGIWRRKREYRSSVATISEIYQGTHIDQDITVVRNAIKIQGLVYEGLPVEYETNAASSWITDPPQYFALPDVNNDLIETGPLPVPDGTSRAEIVGDALLEYHNNPGDRVSITFRGNGAILSGDTVTITQSRLSLSGASRYVLDIRHTVGNGNFTTTITGLQLP